LCAISGMPAGDACPTRVSEWVPTDASGDRCTWHHATDRGLITVWPEPYREWARSAGLLPPGPEPIAVLAAAPAEAIEPKVLSDARPLGRRDDKRLTITRPLGGALFLLDPSLRPEFQALTFSARGGDGPLEWFVNGASIAVVNQERGVRWPLARGRQRISVKDQRGEMAETIIVVR
jgi:membrane carboxypeptidase/penicillin-binding protein PbpC